MPGHKRKRKVKVRVKRSEKRAKTVDEEKPKIRKAYGTAASRDYFDWPDDFIPPVYDFDTDPYWAPDETVYYLGSRGSGKTTTCLAWLLAHRCAYANVYCMTNTAINNFWQQVLPADKVLEGYSEEVLSELLDLSEENLSKWRSIYVQQSKVKGVPYNAVIFEDLIDGNMLRKSPAARRLFYNGRHAGLSGHILSQDYVGLTPGERDNVDRMVIFRATDKRTRDALRSQFGDSFLRMLDRVTSEPHTAVVVNNRSNVPKEDMVRKLQIDYASTVGKALRSHKVLGNKRCWGDIDIDEQRAQYLYTDFKPTYATMKRKWNERIAQSDSEQSGDDERDALADIDLGRAADEADTAAEDENVDYWTPTWLKEYTEAISSRFADWW